MRSSSSVHACCHYVQAKGVAGRTDVLRAGDDALMTLHLGRRRRPATSTSEFIRVQ